MLTQEIAMRDRDGISIDRDGSWNCFCSNWMYTAVCPHCKGTFTLFETWAAFCPACGGEIGYKDNTRHSKDALLFELGFLIDKDSREVVNPEYAGIRIHPVVGEAEQRDERYESEQDAFDDERAALGDDWPA